VKNRKLIDEILKYANERGIDIPADVLLDISRQDAKSLLDQLKVTLDIKPTDLPIFNLREPGAVPAPIEKGLTLTSEGWKVPPKHNTVYLGAGASSGGGGVTDHAALTNLDYASAGHTGFEPTDATIVRTGDVNYIDLTDGGATTLHSHAAGGGDVTGPASAVGDNFASFNLATGKIIKDSGSKAADFAPALGVNDNYVTDAQLIVIGNTSGTNTGDQNAAGVANTPAGNISSITVQAALNELDTEKTTLAAVKADADVASAISLKHTQGTDTALGAVGVKNPPIDADKALYRDSVASDALVTSTWTQVKAFLKTYFDGLYGNVIAPATNTDNFVPQWNGANSKTLKTV
jgi:hypothetical protein